MKKQIICLFLALLTLSGGLPVFAASVEGPERREEPFLEYEGAAAEGEESLAVYEELLKKRAGLSEETLAAYGYTEEQIALLRAFQAGEKAFREVAAATSACLTTRLCCLRQTQKYYVLSWEWKWSAVPLFGAGDGAALLCRPLRDAAREIGVRLEAYSSNVNYYSKETGALVCVRRGDLGESNVCFLSAAFSCEAERSLLQGGLWARSGVLYLALTPIVPGAENNIARMQVRTGYGHTLSSDPGAALSIRQTPEGEMTFSTVLEGARAELSIRRGPDSPITVSTAQEAPVARWMGDHLLISA